MKKRILSLALSAAMLFGSINFAVAEEAPVLDSQESAVEELTDEAVPSGAAVALADSDTETTDDDSSSLKHYPKSSTGDWIATVSGDVGGQQKLTTIKKETIDDNFETVITETNSIELVADKDGNMVPAWEINAKGDNAVQIKAGTVNTASNSVASSAGKVASTSEGMAYYGKWVDSNEDFVMTATATINEIANNDNQVAFGISAIDDLVVDSHYPDATSLVPPLATTTPPYADSINVGRVRMKEVGKTMANGWYRINKELYSPDTARGSFLDESLACSSAMTAPLPKDVYYLEMRKSGDIYTLSVTKKGSETEKVVVDASAPHGAAGLPISLTGDIFVGVSATRAIDVDFTDIDLKITKPIVDFEIESLPNKLEYYTTEPFDFTGLALKVTYEDGTTGIITDPDEFTVLGFDNMRDYSFNTNGDKTLTISVGKAEPKTFNINVHPMKIVSQEIKYNAAYNDFFVGSKFNPYGLTVRYFFENDTYQDLEAYKNKISINGKVVDENTYITSDMIGDAVVTLEYPDGSIYDKNGNVSSYNIEVNAGELERIVVSTFPSREVYYVGDTDIDTAGLTVQAVYRYNGQANYRTLDPEEYTVSGLDTTKENTSLPLVITYNEDKTKTTTFNVVVKYDTAIRADFTTYPRLTYSVGEVFDPTGMNVKILYASNKYVPLCEDGIIYLYDGTKYYTSEGKEVTKADAEAADFYVDLTAFNNMSVGTTTVSLVYNKNVVYFTDTVLDISVVESKDYVWKAALLGSSSIGVNLDEPETSEIIATINGQEYTSSRTQHNIAPQVMINGQLPTVDSVRLNSWDGCGKVSGDQDGIAYYYTRVSNKNNFRISADIEVNRYIRDIKEITNESSPKFDKTIYNNYTKYLAEAKAEGLDDEAASIKALDRLRSGQECFGIMAKDVIQFAGGIDANGQYTGGLNNHMTTNPEDAMKNTVTYTAADGTTKTIETPVDLYEACVNDYTVTDSRGFDYSVTLLDINSTFASNMVLAGACTDSTYPTDKTSSTYYKKTQMNRINIMVRSGVSAPDGGGERIGIKSTTESVPLAGDKYNVTLEKINGGYMITTYDYQTGKTATKRDYEDFLECENVLGIQDNDNIYVGFFASRFADCTVTNIQLHETDPATDPIYTDNEKEAVTPKISINSPLYVTYDNYSLSLKSTNESGGRVTISQNGKTIYTDVGVGRKYSTRDFKLVRDSVNRFTIVYYPSTADDLTSYEPQTLTFNVTHKSIDNTKLLYVGPNGSVSGDGTRENPIDLETAIGLVDMGGTIICLDGTYKLKNTDNLAFKFESTASGLQGRPKTMMAEEGANPIIDLENEFNGFSVDADYWIFDGLTFQNAGGNMKAFQLAGSYNTVKNCTFRYNGDTGFQVSRINSDDKTIDMWASHNLIESCESYNNCDPSKNNADGFAAKLTVGYNNVFKDCISHHNLDDGWDCYTKLSTGAIGASSLVDCITYRMGYKLNENGTETDYDATSGGNGFKLGGENIYVMHYVKDCIAFENKSSGIDSNFNPALKARNVILYNNITYNLNLYSGTAKELKDANGLKYDSQNRSYKFDYDLKGVVSVGNAIDYVGSVNAQKTDSNGQIYYVDDTSYANVSSTPIISESNYIKKYKDTSVQT
ncbi:MAG: bacterial Ig-like domain-containing protein, partial [Lachnospirales bacterium]